jgi:hypothetical protein
VLIINYLILISLGGSNYLPLWSLNSVEVEGDTEGKRLQSSPSIPLQRGEG